MKIEGTYTIAAPRQLVYELMRNPEYLQACIPGCEEMVEKAPGSYQAKIVAKIAAFRGTFSGNVQIADENPPNSYRLIVEGAGGPGHVRGDAIVQLTDTDGGTNVEVGGDGQVGGMIAGVGQRMLLPAARSMMNQFFGCMKDKIEAAGG